MQDTVFSYSGEVQPALVCLVVGAIAVVYVFALVAGQIHARRRQHQAMTSDELQARIARDVTSADVDRLLPKSLRKDPP